MAKLPRRWRANSNQHGCIKLKVVNYCNGNWPLSAAFAVQVSKARNTVCPGDWRAGEDHLPLIEYSSLRSAFSLGREAAMRMFVEYPVSLLGLSPSCVLELQQKGILKIIIERDVTRTFLCDGCQQHKSVIEIWNLGNHKLCDSYSMNEVNVQGLKVVRT